MCFNYSPNFFPLLNGAATSVQGETLAATCDNTFSPANGFAYVEMTCQAGGSWSPDTTCVCNIPLLTNLSPAHSSTNVPVTALWCSRDRPVGQPSGDSGFDMELKSGGREKFLSHQSSRASLIP